MKSNRREKTQKTKFVLIECDAGKKVVGRSFDTFNEAKEEADESHLIFEVVGITNVIKSKKFETVDLDHWLS